MSVSWFAIKSSIIQLLTDGNTTNKSVPNKVLFFLLLQIIPEKAKARQPRKPIT